MAIDFADTKRHRIERSGDGRAAIGEATSSRSMFFTSENRTDSCTGHLAHLVAEICVLLRVHTQKPEAGASKADLTCNLEEGGRSEQSRQPYRLRNLVLNPRSQLGMPELQVHPPLGQARRVPAKLHQSEYRDALHIYGLRAMATEGGLRYR